MVTDHILTKSVTSNDWKTFPWALPKNCFINIDWENLN